MFRAEDQKGYQTGPLPKGIFGTWSLYDASGMPVIPFDTFFDMAFVKEGSVAQKPVEMGKFVNFNKTVNPAEIKVTLGQTGSPLVIAATLEALGKAQAGTELLSLVTPEKTFVDINLTRFDYDRKASNGVDRLIVALTLEEISQVEARYSNEELPPEKVKNKQDASTTERGKQQGQGGESVEKKKSTLKKGVDGIKDWVKSDA